MRSSPVSGRASAAWTLALTLLALPVHASQLNLRWNACFGDGGIRNRDFACNSNSGAEPLVVSFAPPFAMTEITTVEVEVRMVCAGTSIPAWWQLSPITGNCRPTSLATQFTPPLGSIACQDGAHGLASGPTSYTHGTLGNNFGVVLAISQVPTAQAANLCPGVTAVRRTTWGSVKAIYH